MAGHSIIEQHFHVSALAGDRRRVSQAQMSSARPALRYVRKRVVDRGRSLGLRHDREDALANARSGSPELAVHSAGSRFLVAPSLRFDGSGEDTLGQPVLTISVFLFQPLRNNNFQRRQR